ncbi:MAG: GMC oxidoreductase [Gemmatimonadaceae bacterium]
MRVPPSVILVGAGAAGLSLAHSLASREWLVTLVEGGGDQPLRGLEDTYRVSVVGTPHRGVHEGRFRAWGGSTTRWGGQLWPWEPHEFQPRPTIGVDGWPIRYDDVAAWYEPAFTMMRVQRPLLTEQAAARCGVESARLESSPFAIKYSTWLPWRLRNLGRTLGAPLRRNARVTIHANTTVTGFEFDSRRARVTGVRMRAADGAERTIRASHVVLAAGALENVRLLFAAAEDGDAPGNSSGWLGRAFMDHLSVRVARFRPADRNAFARMFAPVFVGDIQYTPRLVARPEVLERERLLSAYGHWDVAPAEGSALDVLRAKLRRFQAGEGLRMDADDLRRLASGMRDVYALARGLLVDKRRWFPRDAQIHLRVDTEQLPDRESRLFASGDRDSYGLPRLVLDWRISELERRTVVRTAELLAAQLEKTGVGVLDPIGDPFSADRDWGELRGDSFHMMGGTRMANDSASGVVDVDCKVFGMENLYIAGASVFPTGGMANPTLTLIALALRLADHLARAHSTAA